MDPVIYTDKVAVSDGITRSDTLNDAVAKQDTLSYGHTHDFCDAEDDRESDEYAFPGLDTE